MGPFTAPNPSSITLTKVAGVPPFDSFNNNGNNFGNIEGDCWLGDALYVSEIASGNNPPPARILRVTGDRQRVDRVRRRRARTAWPST